jgi:hypothetical protein
VLSRIVSTAVLVLLAGSAFYAQATFATSTDGGLFLVVGIVCLGLSIVNWFVWDAVREGWSYGRGSPKDGPGLPVAAWLWPAYIKGLSRALGAPDADRPERGDPKRADR